MERVRERNKRGKRKRREKLTFFILGERELLEREWEERE